MMTHCSTHFIINGIFILYNVALELIKILIILKNIHEGADVY